MNRDDLHAETHIGSRAHSCCGLWLNALPVQDGRVLAVQLGAGGDGQSICGDVTREQPERTPGG